jgi:ATP phosphoribosyltransferase regulatory subunit
VATPLLEYYDVFETSRAHFPQEDIYKLIDRSGRILVLRPDCTIPIARLVSSRFKNSDEILRVYYHQSVYRLPHQSSASSGEIDQMGVEILGEGGFYKDLEILELAAKSLVSICDDSYQIELCHIDYFKALVESLNAKDDEREEIRETIEHKNFPALERLLNRFADSPAKSALRRLPALFGGPEVLDEARSLFTNERADRALNDLMRIYSALCELRLDGHFMIDLGLVHQADYYTGIIFRGYAEGAGEPVLSGGRYDRLLGEFGLQRPATGFGINLDVLSKRMGTNGSVKKGKALIVLNENSPVSKLYALIQTLREQSKPYELFLAGEAETTFDKNEYDAVYYVSAKDNLSIKEPK